jgi:hypothetical protein
MPPEEDEYEDDNREEGCDFVMSDNDDLTTSRLSNENMCDATEEDTENKRSRKCQQS